MPPMVLIVEDDASLRDIIRATLADEGMVAEAVADGPSALEHIHRRPPALILLDLNLPGMDGRDLFTCVREAGITAPVIFMTGWRWAKSEAERYGADGYIAKPFDFDDLVALVHQYL